MAVTASVIRGWLGSAWFFSMTSPTRALAPMRLVLVLVGGQVADGLFDRLFDGRAFGRHGQGGRGAESGDCRQQHDSRRPHGAARKERLAFIAASFRYQPAAPCGALGYPRRPWISAAAASDRLSALDSGHDNEIPENCQVSG